MIIKETLENSKPVRVKQWLHDRRDSNIHYAFWFIIAAIALTLIFGLVQSITGILQVT